MGRLVNIVHMYDGAQKLLQQTPGSSGQWGSTRFHINGDAPSYDAVVVLQGMKPLPSPMRFHCPKDATILMVGEPPNLLNLPDHYLDQFGLVLWPGRESNDRRRISHFFGQYWQLENKSYDQLKALERPRVFKDASIITSRKSATPGHQERLALIAEIQRQFPERVDVFGRGVNEIADKWEGLYGYRYHICLENGCYPDYWTEKLTDAFMAYSYPIYGGCPNIYSYFDRDALIAIDPGRIAESIAIIANALDTKPSAAQELARENARHKILDEYNLFSVLSRRVHELASTGSRRDDVTLYPATKRRSLFSLTKRVLR